MKEELFFKQSIVVLIHRCCSTNLVELGKGFVQQLGIQLEEPIYVGVL